MTLRTFALATALGLALSAAPAFARQPSTYQVTGEVTDVADDMVTVMKGKEKFEIARDGETKLTGDLKKGAKVIVSYRMRAATIEVKEGKKGK